MKRQNWVRAFGLAVVLGAGSAASADIVIETVPVGNAGNAADTQEMSDGTTGYGAVGYNYNIGKYEVTAGQYTVFLNAVAATTDANSLYNANMANTSYGSGITQNVVSGGFSYTVDTAFVNRPVNYVSFWDACRFANWLNNGQAGAGTTEYGAYTLTPEAISGNTVTRNPGMTWAVTSEDEWYKAAYYDPNKNGAGSPGYWRYPTGSATAPGRDMTELTNTGNNANHYTEAGAVPIDAGRYTTVAGEFEYSDSVYRTFDQGGNVWEWNEASIDPNGGSPADAYRGMRGGSFECSYGGGMNSDSRNMFLPSSENYYLGFRVTQVPEPMSLGVLGIGVVGMLMGRRGQRR